MSRVEASRSGPWALVGCPLVGWVALFWASESAASMGGGLRVFALLIVVPAVLAAVGNAVVGQRGRALAQASFWAVLVTIALFIPVTVLVGLGLIGNADRSEYVARHEALLREVAVYPGASYFGDETRGSTGGGGYPEGFGPITAYRTDRVFFWDRRAPGKAAVLAWYWSRPPKQCEAQGRGIREAVTGSGVPLKNWTSVSFDCGSLRLSIEPSKEWLTFRVSERG
jgi:hypothetical protein